MIISHRHKFIFIKTKKTAGTSVELALRRLCGPDDIIAPVRKEDEPLSGGHEPRNWQRGEPESKMRIRCRKLFGFPKKRTAGFTEHMPANEVRSLIGDAIWQEYFKFTIVRNPWDRQVSHFYYQTRPGTRRNLSFDRFMRRKRAYQPNHSLYTIDAQMAVDYVIRFENLQEDLIEALKRIGIETPLELPQAKVGIRKDGGNYRSHYTAHTKSLVAEWYAPEIDRFAYSF